MASKKASSSRVSLASELLLLESAVTGIQTVLEHLSIQTTRTEDSRGLEGAIGLLAILAARVKLCRRVVVGAEPARTILAPHNKAGDRQPADDPDVLLV